MRGTAASPADGWGTTACFRLAPRGALACPRPAIFMGTNLLRHVGELWAKKLLSSATFFGDFFYFRVMTATALLLEVRSVSVVFLYLLLVC